MLDFFFLSFLGGKEKKKKKKNNCKNSSRCLRSFSAIYWRIGEFGELLENGIFAAREFVSGLGN